MEDAAFSDEFFRFLRAAVPTVDAAELLLPLHGEPQRWWAAQEAASALAPSARLSEADVARYLGVLQTSEFDHHPGIVFDNVTPSHHHIHTIIRTPNGGDYGADLLRQHHERFDHSGGRHVSRR